MTQVPRSLYTLRLNNNRFSGPIDLSRLPRKMETLDLSHNEFTGSYDWKKLPEDLSFRHEQSGLDRNSYDD